MGRTQSRRDNKEPLPYYKWLWRDWRSNRNVQRMSWQAKGLYRELLDEFWAEGVLPDDPESLADIYGCPLKEFKKFWPEIAPRFEVTNGGLVNCKMDEQRTDTDTKRATLARNGRGGADAKLANASKCQTNASNCQANAFDEKANAFDEKANASKCHIAEQSRAEQSISKEEQEQEQANDLPVVAIAIPDGFSPEMVASAVLMETGLHGQQLMRNLSEVAKAEMRQKREPLELRDALVGAWEQYSRAKAEGKLTQYTKRPENFFGDRDWKDPRLWPWVTGHGPPGKERRLAIDKLKG